MKLVAEYKVVGPIHLKQRRYPKLKKQLTEVIKQIIQYRQIGYTVVNVDPELGLERVTDLFLHIRIINEIS